MECSAEKARVVYTQSLEDLMLTATPGSMPEDICGWGCRKHRRCSGQAQKTQVMQSPSAENTGGALSSAENTGGPVVNSTGFRGDTTDSLLAEPGQQHMNEGLAPTPKRHPHPAAMVGGALRNDVPRFHYRLPVLDRSVVAPHPHLEAQVGLGHLAAGAAHTRLHCNRKGGNEGVRSHPA